MADPAPAIAGIMGVPTQPYPTRIDFEPHPLLALGPGQKADPVDAQEVAAFLVNVDRATAYMRRKAANRARYQRRHAQGAWAR